jgi:Flp pilus assembly protein TadG
MIQLFAVVLPVLILFCGLSIDIGMIELTKLQMQSAADAAALSAELEAERGTGLWTSIAQLDSGINGFLSGSNNNLVSVVETATFGAYNGRNDALETTITKNIHTIFMGALNGGIFTVTVKSVALMTPCVYLMDNKHLQSYALVTTSGSLTGSSCPVYINTNMYLGTSGIVSTEAIDLAGSAASSSVSGYVYPPATYNVPVAPDPLAATTSPTFVGCNHTSTNITSGIVTLDPGTYCKGLNISNAIVNLNPGLYIITGGATWTSATVAGTGVTLFFTQGGGGSYGSFKIQYSIVNLSAPTDSSAGGTPGILVFGDRNWVATNPQDFSVNTSTVYGDGIWYISNTGLYIWSSGVMTGPHYFGIVADNLYYGGTYVIPLNNYSYVSTGNPMRRLGGLIQ